MRMPFRMAVLPSSITVATRPSLSPDSIGIPCCHLLLRDSNPNVTKPINPSTQCWWSCHQWTKPINPKPHVTDVPSAVAQMCQTLGTCPQRRRRRLLCGMLRTRRRSGDWKIKAVVECQGPRMWPTDTLLCYDGVTDEFDGMTNMKGDNDLRYHEVPRIDPLPVLMPTESGCVPCSSFPIALG